jgi:UTP-glucose-1-phosphate uridylyltransferase
MKPTLVILAAGMGSRYGGLKQLDKLGPSGETIMDYSIFDAMRAGFGKVVFVIRKSFEEEFKKVFVDKLKNKIDVEIVFQELGNIPKGISIPEGRTKPWGTGHAILVTKEKVNEPFVVINADDFYGKEAYVETFNYLTNSKNTGEYAMCGYQLGNTLSDFGSVSRGVCQTDSGDYLITVIERAGIEKKNGIITYKENNKEFELKESDIVSMNFWAFHPNLFKYLEEKFNTFIKENADNPKAEFYIPFVIDDLMKENKVKTKVLRSDAKWFGVTYQEDKPISIKKIENLIELGIYPKKLW